MSSLSRVPRIKMRFPVASTFSSSSSSFFPSFLFLPSSLPLLFTSTRPPRIERFPLESDPGRESRGGECNKGVVKRVKSRAS